MLHDSKVRSDEAPSSLRTSGWFLCNASDTFGQRPLPAPCNQWRARARAERLETRRRTCRSRSTASACSKAGCQIQHVRRVSFFSPTPFCAHACSPILAVTVTLAADCEAHEGQPFVRTEDEDQGCTSHSLSYGLRPDCWIGPATCQHESVAGTQVCAAKNSTTAKVSFACAIVEKEMGVKGRLNEARRVVVAKLGQALAGRDFAADRLARRLVKDRSVRIRARRLGLVARPVRDRRELGVGVGEAVPDQDRLERDRDARRGRLGLVVLVDDRGNVGQVGAGVRFCKQARRGVSRHGLQAEGVQSLASPPETWKSTSLNFGNFS